MKRFFLTLLVAAIVFPLWAADIIVTTSSERIDAKIEEVSETEVKYKKADNPNGPLFVIKTDQIASIIYSNGSVSVFEQKKEEPKQPQAVRVASYGVYDAYGIYTPMGGGIIPEYQPGLMIRKTDDFYWLGDFRMDERQYLEYIRYNCQEAWDSYQAGCRLWGAGWGLFGGGTGMFVVGLELYLIGVLGSKIDYSMMTSGAVLLAFGSASLAGCVPLLVVGGIKRNNTHEVYNESCATRQTALEFQLQASQNGLGIAMKF